MHKILTLFVALLICMTVLLSCGQEKAPTPEGAILTGRVTDTDTTVFLAGVKVYEKSHGNLSTTTDSVGIYRLDGVSLEPHTIYFEKDGYQPDSLYFFYDGTLTHPLLSRSKALTKTGAGE